MKMTNCFMRGLMAMGGEQTQALPGGGFHGEERATENTP